MHNAQPDMGLRKNSAQRIRKTGKPVHAGNQCSCTPRFFKSVRTPGSTPVILAFVLSNEEIAQ